MGQGIRSPSEEVRRLRPPTRLFRWILLPRRLLGHRGSGVGQIVQFRVEREGRGPLAGSRTCARRFHLHRSGGRGRQGDQGSSLTWQQNPPSKPFTRGSESCPVVFFRSLHSLAVWFCSGPSSSEQRYPQATQ